MVINARALCPPSTKYSHTQGQVDGPTAVAPVSIHGMSPLIGVDVTTQDEVDAIAVEQVLVD